IELGPSADSTFFSTARCITFLSSSKNETAGMPVMIVLHHPPLRTLIGHMDEIGLTAGASELEAIVSRHRNVERIICGHLNYPAPAWKSRSRHSARLQSRG